MKKTILSGCFVCLAIYHADAQEVLATGGDYFSNANGSLSFTIGEPITETYQGGQGTLTQGQQQPTTEELSISKNSQSIELEIFPNPTTDYLKIRSVSKEIEISLFDSRGRMLVDKRELSQDTDLDFRSYLPGIYYLVVNSGTEFVESIKIIKTQN